MRRDETFRESLHPSVRTWFLREFGKATEAQELCIPDIAERRSVLLSSPTGSGKTLAGFLGIIDRLAREHAEGILDPKGIRCVYVSPLRALAYDIEKNLRQPLAGLGLEDVITVGLRTGDTSTAERQRQRRKPPHILITTPESLAIVLPQKGYREALARCEFVIVDELHAFAENKRGVHLMVSLERLERMRETPLCRIGLSATVAPLEIVSDFLSGSGPKAIVREAGAGRRSLIEVMTPLRKHAYPPAGYTATRVITDIARIVDGNRTTLIFTNTRSGAERITHRLKLALPKLSAFIECHHSSLDRDIRQEVEDRLKTGDLRAVVCSTSLELGIDIGHIDTVIMVSTPKGISRALQRVGRSGHSIHQVSHGVLVATNINDLIECIVCAKLTHLRALEPIATLDYAPDVVIQHLVGMAMGEGVDPEVGFETIRSAYPFRALKRETFDRLLEYLEGGGRSLQHQYRETFGKIEERDGRYHTVSKKIEREYLLNVGTIHADGMVNVLLNRRRLGSVEERFVKGLKPGDIFVLAGKTVKLIDSSPTEVIVENAAGRLPTVPSWNANKMPLGSGIAREVARLRTEMDRRMNHKKASHGDLADWLVEDWSISQTNAEAIIEHFENQSLLSMIPTQKRFLIERFVDEQDDEGLVHFFFHSLIGRSANDALSRIVSQRLKTAVGGNTLVTIDDYGFLLSVKEFQSLEVEAWKELFRPDNAVKELHSVLKDSQLVKWQFSGIAQTGLMVPRNLPGADRKTRQLRWSADILFQVLAEHEPDHPLLEQAVYEATHTFLDTDRAIEFLKEVQSLKWQLVDVPAVSPFAFGLYASKIKEGMMMESPEEAIERLYHEMQRKLGREVK
ncbi:MAG: DEAD/DEAH box helicase [Verrucomicrobiales bacterium]|nr:DEAD/DEAH box helicase [Verrucomicrobiales bacterium]